MTAWALAHPYLTFAIVGFLLLVVDNVSVGIMRIIYLRKK